MEVLHRNKLTERILQVMGTVDIDIEHQCGIPGGGWKIRIDGRELGLRTTLKGMNIQVNAFLEGWKAYRDWNNKQNGH